MSSSGNFTIIAESNTPSALWFWLGWGFLMTLAVGAIPITIMINLRAKAKKLAASEVIVEVKKENVETQSDKPGEIELFPPTLDVTASG
jgi:hypothetical protein